MANNVSGVLILEVFALVFVLLAAFNVPAWPRVSWGWLGVAFLILALLFPNLIR